MLPVLYFVAPFCQHISLCHNVFHSQIYKMMTLLTEHHLQISDNNLNIV